MATEGAALPTCSRRTNPCEESRQAHPEALVQVKAIAGSSWQFDIRTFADVRYTAGAQTMG